MTVSSRLRWKSKSGVGSVMGRFSIAICVLAAASACAPNNDSHGDAVVVAAAPVNSPLYVSNKQVTSDCGVEYIPVPAPGFAEPPGVKTRKMPPPIASRQAVGAGRELQPTDWDRVAPGYVLIEPLSVRKSFLVNNEKEVVASFEGDYYNAYTQLLPNGNRLIESQIRSEVFEDGGGKTGCVEERSADGELLWRVNLSSDKYVQHHDVIKLENGNILALIWELASADEAISQGRDPARVAENGAFWYDGVIEVNPYTMQIVWEWSLKHHLIQDFDKGKPNYGVVADNPGRLDINKVNAAQETVRADWTHVNALDYHPELDQIVLSSNYLHEIWIIDHSTTAWESIGPGGDFLYRWGNPANYNRGGVEDRVLFNQHDIQWILPGLPGAGNMLVYNNGDSDARPYTTVVEFSPQQNPDGSYVLVDGAAYGPEAFVWEYNPPPAEQFFSWFISGAQRLANGNTLVLHGAGGHVREVTPSGDIVWDYSYKDEVDAPHMIFRTYRYPADHPGLAYLLMDKSGNLEQ